MNAHINSWSTRTSAALLALFLLFYLHPYYGIRHDSILYLGQALRAIDPENFNSDLFFQYGSQASFTIFPQLIAVLLQRFDAAQVFLGLTSLGLVFFLVGSAALLFRLFPSPQRYWGLLALLILPSYYGGFGIISYAESFFTGRSLAEPLVLIALACYFGNKKALSLITWFAAASLHPLQALPALMIIWFDLTNRDRRWLHLLWLPASFIFLTALGTQLTERLTLRYDDEWYNWFRGPNGFVYLTDWHLTDWAIFTTDVFLTVLLMLRTKDAARRLSAALLYATLLAFLSSLLLGDILHFVLATSLQLWRIHWLLHWLAMASVPYLIYRQYLDEGSFHIRSGLLLVIVAVGMSSPSSAPSAFAVWILIPLYLSWPKLRQRITPIIHRLLLTALILVLCVILVKHGLLTYSQLQKLGLGRDNFRLEFVLLSHPLISASAVALALYLYNTRGVKRAHLLITMTFMVVFSLTEWDRRSTWTRFIESAQYNPKLFGYEFEPKAQIYWAGELMAPWILLHRPSYFHSQQMGGMLFNRDTAKAASKREGDMKLIEFQLSACRLMNELNKSAESCSVDVSAVTETCRLSEDKLDYLILDNNLGKNAIGTWKIIGGTKGNRQITYYVYRCRDFTDLSK